MIAIKKIIQGVVNKFGYEVKRVVRTAPPILSEAGPVECDAAAGRSEIYGVTDEKRFIVTEALYSRLNEEAKNEFAVFVKDNPQIARSLENAPRAHLVRETLRLGGYYLGEIFYPLIGIKPFNPPKNVHAMVREDVYCGDMYYCDLVTDVLDGNARGIRDGGVYLDFGASSGRVVSTLSLAYPRSEFYGCDPNVDAIGWAKKEIKTAKFFVSPESPPLDMPNKMFDGVYAISIWSHFSEGAALRWLDEMHRIIKDNGFLIVTTHGYGSLDYYAEHGAMTGDEIEVARNNLDARGYHFIDVFRSSCGDWGVGEVDWGQSFISPAFLLKAIGGKWAIEDYRSRRSEGNQDVYLLQRRSN